MDGDEVYFACSRGWAVDGQERDARSRRVAWLVAGVAVAVAAFEAVALAMLAPLKTVQPVTVLVDRQTGFVETIDPAQPRRIGADAALTQSMLAQYVAAREGFDRATVSAEYRHVAIWSAGAARAQYLAQMRSDDPSSPARLLAAGEAIDARVKSVSPLANGVALVRFDTLRMDRSGREAGARPWIAVVRYRYLDAPMRFEDRLANPLGFQVVSYRRDAEAAEAPSVTAPDRAQALGDVAATGAAASRSDDVATVRAGSVRILPADRVPLGSPLGPVVLRTAR